MSLPRRVARLRRRIGQAAWRAALGPAAGSVPRRGCRSLAGGESVRITGDPLLAVELLAPAHVKHYPFAPALPPWFRRAKAFDDRYLYRLRDFPVSPSSGLCSFPGGTIVNESVTGSVARLLGWGGQPLEDLMITPRRTVEGPVVVLPARSYSHWLLEDLPAALHALERAPEATVVVPASPPRYLEQALELLGVTRVVRSDEPLRAEELVLAARDPSYEFSSREDLDVLRRMLVPRAGRGGEEAVYVSRRLEARHPGNEAELERALSAAGFAIVTASALGFAEQVALFSGARFVAGPHGAGLANVVWSSQPEAVSELFEPWLLRDCFARLAVTLGASYRALFAQPGSGAQGSVSVAEVVAGARGDPLAKLARPLPAGG